MTTASLLNLILYIIRFASIIEIVSITNRYNSLVIMYAVCIIAPVLVMHRHINSGKYKMSTDSVCRLISLYFPFVGGIKHNIPPPPKKKKQNTAKNKNKDKQQEQLDVFVKHRCPGGNKVKIWQKSLYITLITLYYTNKYCILFVTVTELRTDRRLIDVPDGPFRPGS